MFPDLALIDRGVVRRDILYNEPPGVAPAVLRVLRDEEGGEAWQEGGVLALQCGSAHQSLLLLLLCQPSLTPDKCAWLPQT